MSLRPVICFLSVSIFLLFTPLRVKFVTSVFPHPLTCDKWWVESVPFVQHWLWRCNALDHVSLSLSPMSLALTGVHFYWSAKNMAAALSSNSHRSRRSFHLTRSICQWHNLWAFYSEALAIDGLWLTTCLQYFSPCMCFHCHRITANSNSLLHFVTCVCVKLQCELSLGPLRKKRVCYFSWVCLYYCNCSRNGSMRKERERERERERMETGFYGYKLDEQPIHMERIEREKEKRNSKSYSRREHGEWVLSDCLVDK